MENREGAQKRKRIFERTSQRSDFGSEFLPYELDQEIELDESEEWGE